MLRSARSALVFLAFGFLFEVFVLLFDFIFTGFSGNSNLVTFQYFDFAGLAVILFSFIAVMVTRNTLILSIFTILTVVMLAAFIIDLVLRASLIGFGAIVPFVAFFLTIVSVVFFAIISVQEYRNAIETNDINHGKVQPLQDERTLFSSTDSAPLLTPLPATTLTPGADSSVVTTNATSSGLNYTLTTPVKRTAGTSSTNDF